MNLARWRLAARLARREVRRHWARSALVVVIIAIPVLAAQSAAIAYRSVRTIVPIGESRQIYSPEMAGADEMTGFDPRLGRPPAVVGAERVATGFDIEDWTIAEGGDRDDLVQMRVVGFVPDESEVDLVEGDLPTTRREAVVSSDLADDAGLEVGDRFEVVASQVELEVVGVSGSETDDLPVAWAGPVVDGDDWVPDALARLRDSGNDWVSASMFDLYWYPADAVDGPSEIDTGADADPGPDVEAVVVGSAGGAIAIGFVATICSVAFAIGARRQLRVLGTLSTAGAGPADLVRAVLLQGTCLGLTGAALATVLAYAGRLLVVRTLIDSGVIADGEQWSIAWAPDLVLGVAVLGVAAGTLAALVPALTASRIPALSALAGRRPTRRRPLRSPYAGLALLVVGLAMLTWASGRGPRNDTGQAAVAAIAVLLVMAGSVAVSPGVVAALGRICGRSRGTTRLAGRSIARDGMRSAAIVATTAVAVAIPVIVLVWGAREVGGRPTITDQQRADLRREQQAEDAVGRADVYADDGSEGATAVLDDVRRIMGDDTVVAHERVSFDTANQVRSVDPDELARVTGDDDVADALRDGDLVVLDRNLDDSGDGHYYNSAQATPDEGQELVRLDPEAVSQLTLVLLAHTGVGLVAEDTVADSAAGASLTVLRPTPLTDAEGDELLDLSRDEGGTPTYAELRDLTTRPSRSSGISVQPDTAYDDRGWLTVPWELVAFAASALVALLVIGVASALAAADGRPDEQIVAAVGAPPSVVRRRRVLEATFTAAAAAVLGGTLGAVATLLVIHAPLVSEEGASPLFRFPLLRVVGTLGGTVAVVGLVTWLALAVGARLRGRRDLFLGDA